MNILLEPVQKIIPNSPINMEEWKVANEVVDEFMASGVLHEPKDDSGTLIVVITNSPLNLANLDNSILLLM